MVEGGLDELDQRLFWIKNFRINFLEQCEVSNKLSGQCSYSVGEMCDRRKDFGLLFLVGGNASGGIASAE